MRMPYRTQHRTTESRMADAPLKVLIVDDEAPARRRLRELLDDCTSALPLVVVGEAASGREALELLGSTPTDLVLSDIHMPDMDGIELARHLLKLPLPPVVDLHHRLSRARDRARSRCTRSITW